MDEAQSRQASVRAGAVAGVAGFAVFLLIHHLWIAPIWSIAPVGGLLAVAGGTAVGAAYAELLPHLPRRPWASVAMGTVIAAVLLPAIVVAEVRGPVFAMDRSGGGTFLVPGAEVAVEFVGGLLGTAVIAGAGIGWLIARSRRAAATLALAALVIALGPGHNIPLLGGTAVVAKELAILATVLGVASVVLVEGHAWLVRRPAVVDGSVADPG